MAAVPPGMSAAGTDESASAQEMERLRRRVSELEARERELSAAQAGLHTAALRQRALLDALPDMVFRMARDGTFLDFSAPERSTFLAPEGIIGANVDDLPFTPAARRLKDEAVAQALASGETQAFRYALPSAAGERHYEARVGRSGADELVVTVRDITQQHHAEREIARRIEREHLIARMSQRFLRYNPEQLDTEIDSALAALGEFVAADRSYLFLVSADGRRVSNTHEWCAPEVSSQIHALQDLSLEEFGRAWHDLSRGDVLHVPSVAALPVEAQPLRVLLEMQQIRSLVLVPLFLDGRVSGCLGLDRVRTEQRWSDEDAGLLRTAVDIIASAIQRQGIERDQRASEQKFYSVFASSPDMILISTIENGAIVEVNPAFERILGYERYEAIGRSTIELEFWVDPQERARLVHHVLTQGTTTRFEARIRCRSGTVLDTLIAASAINIDGRPSLLTVVRDISERKHMELALRNSETVLRSIIDNIPHLVWLKDPAGRFLAANWAFARACGCESPARVVGSTDFDLWNREFAEKCQAEDRTVMETGYQQTIQEVIPAGEEPRWFETFRSPVYDRSANLIGTTGLSHDITERRRAEQVLRENDARLRQFAEHVPFIVWMATPDNRRVLFVNAAYETVFGRPREALLADPLEWRKAIHPDDRHRVPEVRDLTHVRGAQQEDFRIVRADGAVRWLHNRVIALRDEAGKVNLHAGISEDVTDRKRAEQEVRELNAVLESRVAQRTAALEASLRELESFSYSVSHDLRTPLRGINGFSHLLLEDYGSRLDDNGHDYLRRICAASQRMGDLIDDLLTLARISRSELHACDVDLGLLAQEVAAELRQIEPERTVDLAVAADMTVEGDPNLLRILVENLLGNAWKFTARSGAARIEFAIDGRQAQRVFFMRDNGVGFDSAFAHKLFQPFERLHGMEDYPGSGVGLATAKRIVTRHGGRIWAEGRPGSGATFYFTLG